MVRGAAGADQGRGRAGARGADAAEPAARDGRVAQGADRGPAGLDHLAVREHEGVAGQDGRAGAKKDQIIARARTAKAATKVNDMSRALARA